MGRNRITRGQARRTRRTPTESGASERGVEGIRTKELERELARERERLTLVHAAYLRGETIPVTRKAMGLVRRPVPTCLLQSRHFWRAIDMNDVRRYIP